MHNLVKEATGIDFMKFGDDLKAAKEVTLQALDANEEKCSIEACPSVGHVLNEVGFLDFRTIFTLISCFVIYYS